MTEQQRAEQVRRDFAANVSHELKTPLTSISGFAEMMENGMADNSQDVRRFAGRIYTQAQRLIALTDDIIRLSRIERADLTENVPVELRALCDRAVETLTNCFRRGGKLLLCGNGGSAADCAHILGEFVKSFCKRRPLDARLPADARRTDYQSDG